jgi:hypothetical protein
MDATTILSVVATGVAFAAAAIAAIDKLPFVQKNKTLKTWIDDANDIAGELKLIVPMGSTVDQVKALAEGKAAAVVEKYAGGVTQGEVVTQVLGEFARIVQSGHVLPPAAQPVLTDAQAILAKLDALIAAQAAQVPVVAVTPPAAPATTEAAA